jgi:hypothetical protein
MISGSSNGSLGGAAIRAFFAMAPAAVSGDFRLPLAGGDTSDRSSARLPAVFALAFRTGGESPLLNLRDAVAT